MQAYTYKYPQLNVRLFVRRIQSHRFGLIALITAIVVAVSFITRLVLLLSTPGALDISLMTILEAFIIGFFFDLVNASYFIIPILVYLWICPERLYSLRWHKYILHIFLFVFTSLIIFDSISEWFFWEEFTTRFNFIAVDYLVYTTEVIGNIRQSYPVEWFVIGALAASGLIVFNFRSWTTH